MNERTFQAAVKYGGIVLALCLILNVWVVMRHVEIYRDAGRADAQFQQLATQQQLLQAVLQDFAARASSDAEIANIFKKAQTMNSAPSPLSNQPLQPTVPTR